MTVDLVDDDGVATGETYCRLAFTETYDPVLRLGIMAVQGYTMEFDPGNQTIRYAPSAKSTKASVESVKEKFKLKMPDPELPERDDCYYYGICGKPEKGEWTTLSTAKLVSCLGGIAVWFILLFWVAPLLPDFAD